MTHGDASIVVPQGGIRPARVCRVARCGKKHSSNGYCRNHARRFKLYGDPFVVKQVTYRGLTPEQYFWKHVRKNRGCWRWRGYTDGYGYGLWRMNGVHYRATHVAWEMTYGTLPQGMHVFHHCDNPPCVNPDHLFIGTMADNIKDMYSKGRGRGQFTSESVRGEHHGMAKLTALQVKDIRASSESSKALAAFFGVTPETINMIRRRQTWRHID
jgi:hypothetical protein